MRGGAAGWRWSRAGERSAAASRRAGKGEVRAANPEGGLAGGHGPVASGGRAPLAARREGECAPARWREGRKPFGGGRDRGRLAGARKEIPILDLLLGLNPVLRGWCNYFSHGVSSRSFKYLDHYAFWRIVGWLRKRHVGLNWGTLHRRYLPGWEVRDGTVVMCRPRAVPVTRYRYRGARIPTPWTSEGPTA